MRTGDGDSDHITSGRFDPERYLKDSVETPK